MNTTTTVIADQEAPAVSTELLEMAAHLTGVRGALLSSVSVRLDRDTEVHDLPHLLRRFERTRKPVHILKGGDWAVIRFRVPGGDAYDDFAVHFSVELLGPVEPVTTEDGFRVADVSTEQILERCAYLAAF